MSGTKLTSSSLNCCGSPRKTPAAITKTLQSMCTARAPDYDYEDRLRDLLELLADHGQREAIIVLSDRLQHFDGVQSPLQEPYPTLIQPKPRPTRCRALALVRVHEICRRF